MRDWRKTLRRASFRGVPFFVETSSLAGGRRVAVFQTSGGENHQTEDMGRRAREIRITGYLASDTADLQSVALRLACDAPGASLLALPMDMPVSAHCLTCEPSFDKNRLGYVGFDMTFVEEGLGAAAVATGLPALRNSFASNLPVVSAVIGEAIGVINLADAAIL